MNNKMTYMAPGIPDEFFIRGKVPMTKEEIRTVTLAKAQIQKDNCVYDVGAGTGSISIEAALLANQGKVFAIEKNPQGVALILENKKNFKVENLEAIAGSAPEALKSLPDADRIIIGGTGGTLADTLQVCAEKLKPLGIIVINAITIDTLWYGIANLEKLGFITDTCVINVSKLMPLGTTKAFQSNNPVYIIRGVKS
ncbi:precorrin-6Y C5,15-methyltransferase (decarboxylating) subunit CbiT [Bacillota bacterium LX-D]|nr:precorrin-6Y C5,15-methyltransferase (decarboxylating) subunit CbiT [Bacillota bacterium LX-D]